ncbi:MAG: DUF21 domain-containing protein [Candidatus Omnitrophica bacterium]|nr:DUF21 domain-containing protein [Candidatus Omnitrophota bacterium]
MNSMYLLAALFLMGLQAFFCASEISFISSNPLSLHHREAQGNKNAGKVYRLLQAPEKFLATMLVGINLSLVLSSSLLTFFLIGEGIEGSSFWATVFCTPMIVIFAELIPKNIGRYFKEDFSCATVEIIVFFERLFAPAFRTIEIMSRALIVMFVGKVRRRSLFVAKEEIQLLVREAQETGSLDKGEKEAIDEVFAFTKSRIKDSCVTIDRVVVARYGDTYEKIMGLVRATRITRFPVLKREEIIGYINVYDLFYNSTSDWHAFIRPIARVSSNQNLYDVFVRLKERKENIAVVFRGKRVYGIITFQDVIKEIVSSIIKI